MPQNKNMLLVVIVVVVLLALGLAAWFFVQKRGGLPTGPLPTPESQPEPSEPVFPEESPTQSESTETPNEVNP